MTDTTQYVTKADLEENNQILIGYMNDMFDRLIEYMDRRFEALEKQMARMAGDLDLTIERVDNHDARIIKLERYNRKHTS